MHPHQRRRRLHISHHQRYGFFHAAISVGSSLSPKTVNPELPPAGRKVRRRNLFDFVFTHAVIIAAGATRHGCAEAAIFVTILSNGCSPLAETYWHAALHALHPLARKGKMASCLEGMGRPFRVAG